MGLHQLSLIGQGADGSDDAYGSDRDSLSVGHGGQLYRSAAALRLDYVRSFAGEVHAGLLGDAEGLETREIALYADPLGQLDHDHVAGVLDCLGQGLVSVGFGPVPAVEGPVRHLGGSLADEAFVHVGDSVVQGYGRGQQLEGGSRLIGVADAEAPPHLVPVCDLLFGGHGVEDLLVARHRSSGIVGIELVGLGHGLDLGGLGVHYEAHDPGRLVGLLALGDLLLDDVLYVLVQGKDHGISVFGRIVFVGAVGEAVLFVVLADDPAAVLAREILVVIALKAGISDVVVSDGAQQLGREGLEGIGAGRRLHQLDPREPLASDLLGQLDVHVLGKPYELFLGHQDFLYRVRLHGEELRQPVRLVEQVLFLLLFGLSVGPGGFGAHPYRIGGAAYGQFVAVGVEDIAPGRSDDGVSGLLLRGLLGPFLSDDDHVPAHPHREGAEKQ